MVRLLIENQADVNSAYKDRTALQEAAGNGHIDIVELLLGNGADVNTEAVTVDGGTALQVATESGYIDIVKLLLENQAVVNNVTMAGQHCRQQLEVDI